MSSKPWTPTFTQGGITSDDILVNPQWYGTTLLEEKVPPSPRAPCTPARCDRPSAPYRLPPRALANAVEIPYCSSDFFAGNASSAESGLPWHFRGAHIVRAVLADLIARHGLGAAKQVVFSGTSAGGIGTLVNADAVAAALPWADVRSLADSGWFVGNQPFGTPNCSTVFTCPATVGVATGIAYWKPAEPADCLAFANASTAYQCFFGPTLRPFLTSRIYTMQYLFDAAQETFDQALPPWSTAAFEYIEATAASLVASFGATQGVFSPACFLHTMITSDQWGTIKIGDRNLPTAFADWWNGGTEHWVDTCFTPDCNKSCPV